MYGTFDQWVNSGCPDEGTASKPDGEPVTISIITKEDSFLLDIEEEYYNENNGKVCTLVEGVMPGIWCEQTDRVVECSESQKGGYIYARVQYADGKRDIVGGQFLIGFITETDWLDKPPMDFWSYDDMLNLPEPEWLVESVIQKQTSALIFGASNSFKTFLGIDLMMSAATGKDWHGHAVGEPFPCVYIATEGARGVGGQRVPGWIEQHGLPEGTRDNFHICKDEIALDDEASVNAFLKTCAHWKAYRSIMAGDRVANEKDHSDAVGLVVIDIFGASMMGSESSDETARAWVKSVNRIMDEMSCSVLTIAHSGWADQTRARMHSHFWGSFDTRMIAQGDKLSLTTVLKIDRHKDADSTGEWGFRMDKVTLSNGQTTLVPRLCDEVETKQKRRISGKPAVALQALSETLIDHGRTLAGPNYPTCPVVSVETWRTMCDRHGLTDSDNPETARKAFNRAKIALIEKGLIKQFDNNVWKVSAND